MMKQEFEALVGKTVTEAEYKVIEYVYTWHPSIKGAEGKKQMEVLYSQFGMGMIKGMVPVAQKMEELDKEERELKRNMALIHERKEVISEGDMTLETAIDKVNELYMKAESEQLFEKLVKELDFDADVIARARRIADV